LKASLIDSSDHARNLGWVGRIWITEADDRCAMQSAGGVVRIPGLNEFVPVRPELMQLCY